MGHRTVALLATLLATHAFAQTSPDFGEKALDAAAAEARGFDYWFGRGVERDLAQAARWLEQAAEAGRPHASALLAEMYLRGQGVPNDRLRARELATRAAAAGIASAQAMLGLEHVFAQDPRAHDPAAALPFLYAAAEQEEPRALFTLGLMYRAGDGVEANRELSLRLITRAAELGMPLASAEAGMTLLSRNDSGEDVQRGLYFLRTGASSSIGPAAYRLAKLYLTGQHLERDTGLAVQWLTRANDLGVATATVWLAELYEKGLGVTADSIHAAELRAQALPKLSLRDRNEFAWELAVSPATELRNGVLAVEIMETVTVEAPTPAYLDTLAAAYAEAGRFDDAVRAQQRAADALTSGVPDATRSAFAERVALYRAGQRYREAP